MDPPYQLDDDNSDKRKKRTYTEDEVNELVNTRSREAALDAIRERDKERENQNNSQYSQNQNNSQNDGSGDNLIGLDPKFVKQLQNTVGVFNALKEFASSPIQRVIETEVGTMSADVIKQAFRRPQGEPGKRDLVDIVLNSQFAYGLGAGIGQRGPEFIETMDRTFGRKKTEQYFDNILGLPRQTGQTGQTGQTQTGQNESIPRGNEFRRGLTGGNDNRNDSRNDNYTISQGPGLGPGGDAKSDTRARRDAERKLILNLDPNNPEHVSAYADSQGGMSVDVARKVLMIQQDDFIKQLELENDSIKKELSMSENPQCENPQQHKSVPKQAPQAPVDTEELVNPISFKSKKETQKKYVGTEEDIEDIPDRWEGDEGLITKERREYEKAVMLEKEKAHHGHDSSAELVKTEMENRKKLNEQAPPITMVPEVNPVVDEVKPVADEVKPVEEAEEAELIAEVLVPENPENSNIQLVAHEDVAKDTDIKQNEATPDVKLCPKCKKIKPLFETEKGPMCQECKTKRGL